MSENEIPGAVLTRELALAGFSDTPKDLIGKKFLFSCEHGSHFDILVGTITAIKLSDVCGLELVVTNKEIWGQEIRCIKKMKDGWAVLVHQKNDGFRERSKELEDNEPSAELQKSLIDSGVGRFFPGDFYLL